MEKLISFCLTVIFLCGCADSDQNKSMGDDVAFTSTSTFSYASPVLPLIIELNPGDELYQDKMWAIKISKLLADGKDIVAKPSYVDFDDINVDSIEVQSNLFVYKVKINNLLFGDFSPSGDDFSLIEYSIPEDVNELEIVYQFIYFDGKRDSRTYKLRAFRIR